MARPKSPLRDQAFAIWKASGGTKPLKDIAAEIGVSDVQVRKWKNQDKWDVVTKRVTKNKSNNVTKKKNVTKIKSRAVEAVFAVPELEELTERENLFCRFFVNNKNATQAAIKSGYSVNSARTIGYELLRKPHIKAEIERLKVIRNEAIMFGESDIVEIHMRIAFADMTDFAEFGVEDIPLVNEDGSPSMNDDGTMKTHKRNYLMFRDHGVVDGNLIHEIKLGRQGMSLKLESRQKSLDWLSQYFNTNPMNKHKVWYDKEVLLMRERELKIKEF